MFKQFTPYTYTGTIRSDHERTAFVPCGASQPLSLGYVNHSNGEPFIAGVELLMIERKVVPADVVKRAANQIADVALQETGRRPKGKAFKEIKEQVTHELLTKAFPKRKTVPVLWLGEFVLVGATSNSDLNLIVPFLLGEGENLRIDYVKTPREPSEAMTTWARRPDAPDVPFAVGSDLTVLTACDGKATFKSVSTLSPEAGGALAAGTVVALALTSKRGVMFTLTELLQVKSIKVGGVADEGHADAAAAECALMQGELRGLMAELMGALDAA